VCDLVPEHGGVRVQLAGGSSRMADQVILALGSPPGSWPAGLAPVAEDRRMVGDPWAPGALDGPALNELDPARPVVLLGSGLTAVDVAISLRARGHRHLIATSRHGLLPRAHGQQPLTLPAQCPPAATTARELLVWARRASGRIGAWEPVVDALRPDVNDLWAALAPGEQRRLLRHLHRRWEVLRHRMAPEVAATIGSMRERDELTVVTGGVRAARPVAGGVDVVLADREVRAAAVVNCTGPSADIRRSGTPLVRRLLASGIVRPGPLALGLDTDPHGCVPGTGAALWVVGPLRRGGLWETTAIPEIRAQAALLPQLLATTHQPVEV
jgi:uncharacterized NAD(P)/FAD-binding protein YdhS